MVIPAEAGIHGTWCSIALDSRFHGNDNEKFLFLSSSDDFFRMADPSPDSAGSSHGWAGQVDLALGVAHSSSEITIRGG